MTTTYLSNARKLYRGVRGQRGATVRIHDINPDGTTSTKSRSLIHRIHHSPTGLEWGYGGSGPADLARSLLWDVLGEEPPAGMYQRFKFDVVAGLGREGWALTDAEIREWVDAYQKA